MEKFNIEGHVDLARDRKTSAIVNVNSIDYQHYVASRNAKKSKNERVDTMEEDLADLKGELGEIKSLLKELVNGK
jgi:hypothetical protein|tara:strand:+ start:1147 stop:1371 length:225 start_codon:yes stop_codon:yes gene_type:complete